MRCRFLCASTRNRAGGNPFRRWHKSPSSLLGAAAFFEIGIITRCLLPKFSGVLENPLPLLAISLLLSPFSSDKPYEFGLFLWAFAVVGISASQSIIHSYMLENKPALMFGRISYCIYLSHFILLACYLSIWLNFFPRTGKVAAFIGVRLLNGLPLRPLSRI